MEDSELIHIGASEPPEKAFQTIFHSHSTSGCIVIRDIADQKEILYNSDRAKQRYSPASTFKILNALIALELGVVNESKVIAYNGSPTFSDAQRRSLTLAEAFKVSAVWFFQIIARRVGVFTYEKILKEVRYGNMFCSSAVDQFWIDGSLTISAFEQSVFLENLINNQLPFRREVLESVKSMMRVDSVLPGVLRGKTGFSDNQIPFQGWFVGYYEVENRRRVFATQIDIPTIELLPTRQMISELCLNATVDLRTS